MEAAPKIKIPRKLPTALACTRQGRKAVALLLLLKHHFDSGRYKHTKANQLEACKLAGICHNTYLTYIHELNRLGLADVIEGTLYLASWDDISGRFNLKGKLRFYYIPVSGVKHIEHTLEQLVFSEVQAKCEAAFYFYLSINPEVKQELKFVFGTTNRRAIQYSQLENYLTNYCYLDTNEAWALNLFRADTATCYNYWSDLFGYKSFGGMAYKKRMLHAKGFIRVTHRQDVLEHHTTVKSRKSIMGVVKYDLCRKRPVLYRPDEIVLL